MTMERWWSECDRKGIFGQRIIVGDTLGQGEEAAGAADDPGFRVAFKQGAVFVGPIDLRAGLTVDMIGHLRHFPMGQSAPKAVTSETPGNFSFFRCLQRGETSHSEARKVRIRPQHIVVGGLRGAPFGADFKLSE